MRNLRTGFFRGAFWGMLAWQVYAVLEYAVGTFSTPLHYRNTPVLMPPWHWNISISLLAFYTLAGILAGGIGGAALAVLERRGSCNRDYRIIAALTLALAFSANLFRETSHASGLVPGLVLIIALACGLFTQKFYELAGVMSNPWLAAIFLLTSASLTEDFLGHRNAALRLFAGLLFAVGFIAVAFLALRLLASRGGKVLRYAAAVLGGIVLVFGCGLIFDHTTQAKIALPSAAGHTGSRPNILLITLDTVRADHLSLYGYERDTTPNLRRLAQSATLFTRAISAGNITLTGHAAIFTGMYAGSILQLDRAHNGVIPPHIPTLPQILARNGYSTGAIVGNFGTLTPTFGFQRGFEFFDYRTPLRIARSWKDYYLHTGARAVLNRFTCTADFELVSRRAERIDQEAFQLLDRVTASRQPFFLFLNYMDAHWPYLPPSPYDRLYPGKDCSVTDMDGQYQGSVSRLLKGGAPLSDHELQEYVSQYDGGIAYMDAQLGALLAHLQKSGVYDNTIIVITSDHGEALGDHSGLSHGYTLYQDEVHVPLLIKYPGSSRPERIDTWTSHVDLLPTILDVAGIAAPPGVHGRSLKGGAAGDGREVVTESFVRGFFSQFASTNRNERAILVGTQKYIWSNAGTRELYDLAADPAEQHNLCASESGRCSELQQRLDRWATIIPRSQPQKPNLDRDSVERLRSLGYIQ
jgi:arylsulfatase A-like enzyme